MPTVRTGAMKYGAKGYCAPTVMSRRGRWYSHSERLLLTPMLPLEKHSTDKRHFGRAHRWRSPSSFVSVSSSPCAAVKTPTSCLLFFCLHCFCCTIILFVNRQLPHVVCAPSVHYGIGNISSMTSSCKSLSFRLVIVILQPFFCGSKHGDMEMESLNVPALPCGFCGSGCGIW